MPGNSPSDPYYRDGQALRRIALMERELVQLKAQLGDVQRQQETQGKKLDSQGHKLDSQAEKLDAIVETAKEWKEFSEISRKIKGRVGALMIAAILGLPSAAIAIAVQWVNYGNMVDKVGELSKKLSYDPNDRESIPNTMATKEDVRGLTSEVRSWRQHQETRIDNINDRTHSLEAAQPIKRRRRVTTPAQP